MATIYPSLMGIDLLNVQKEIEQIDEFVSGYQLDIMDFHFVPNLTYGPDFVNAVARITYKKLWLHLMVENPIDLLDRFSLPPGTIVSFHIESKSKINETISRIEEKKWLPSIAINPKTPLEKVFPFMSVVHQVLVMSVDPGFSNQLFLKETIGRVATLVGFRQTSGLNFLIGVDGGVNKDNIKSLAREGVDDMAIASAIFDAPDPVQALKDLKVLVAGAEQ
jgi:ribulose-phosphate 3-epimerase